MRLYISTPILRQVVRELDKFDKKAATLIEKTERFIIKRPKLARLMGVNYEDTSIGIDCFLKKDLIEKTMKYTLKMESERMSSNIRLRESDYSLTKMQDEFLNVVLDPRSTKKDIEDSFKSIAVRVSRGF
jgi:hypothetical protein